MSSDPALLPLSRRLPGTRLASSSSMAATSLLLALLVWAALTEVEIVTTAPAVARAGAGTATIRAPASRTVVRLLVDEGASVVAGEPLLRLDSELAEAHWRTARTVLTSRRQALANQRAVLERLDGAADLASAPLPVKVRLLAQQQKLAQLDGQIDVLRTELRLARERSRSAARLAGVAADRTRSIRRAGEVGAVSRFHVQGAEQELWSRQAELELARGAVDGLERQLVIQHRARSAARLDLRNELLEKIAALEVEVAEQEMKLADAAEARRHGDIVAPSAGIVDRLLVMAGDVVERGQAVAVVVPAPASVYFEVRLASSQMGFLRVGLPCRIKLDALPFPRFGALPCTLTRLGGDVAGEGADHYLARVEPSAQTLLADGMPTALRPGASGWVDVVTGRRTVLGYVTEPMQRFAGESLRER